MFASPDFFHFLYQLKHSFVWQLWVIERTREGYEVSVTPRGEETDVVGGRDFLTVSSRSINNGKLR